MNITNIIRVDQIITVQDNYNAIVDLQSIINATILMYGILLIVLTLYIFHVENKMRKLK